MDRRAATRLERAGGSARLWIVGEVVMQDRSALGALGAELLADLPQSLVLDLTKVRFGDVTAVAAVVDLLRSVQAAGVGVEVLASDSVRRSLVAFSVLRDLQTSEDGGDGGQHGSRR